MPPQPSFALKLDRARVHFDALDRQVREWVHGEPYTVIDEPDPEPPLKPLADGFIARRFRVDYARGIPDDFSVLIGDGLFNLRSALDYLALALARAHSARIGAVMTDDQVESSEFPIFFDRPMTPHQEKRKIGCVDPAAGAAIKAMQPHNRGHGYKSDPLWQIHEMNRIDKHRALTVCAADSQLDGESKIGMWYDRHIDVAYGTASNCFDLKKNAVLFRWAGRSQWPGQDVRMKLNCAPETRPRNGHPYGRACEPPPWTRHCCSNSAGVR